MSGLSIIQALNPANHKSFNDYAAPVDNTGGGWFSLVKEPFQGAWQRNIAWERKDVLCYHAVFACISLIASDVSKLNVNVVRKDSNDIWKNIPYDGYEVLTKPNKYQNRIQFFESWMLSKLIRGNAYILKIRDKNEKVVEMHVLHPDRVLPLVTQSGEVLYQLSSDNLSGVDLTGETVPATEIIHDRFNCFYHPLVGLSPLYASGLPAYAGMHALKNNANHYKNGAQPSGILTTPEAIDDKTATELKSRWEKNFSGKNYGKLAVLGGDLKYTALSLTAVESQMIENLKLTAEMICSTFHVPSYKIIGNAPSYNNIEALEQSYYNQSLQVLLEAIELCLDEGLEFEKAHGTEFDIDNLLRMDTKTLIETYGTGINKGMIKPDEGRKKINLGPVPGGDSVYMQQQNYSLAALEKRDSKANPFEKNNNSGNNQNQNNAAPVVNDSAKEFEAGFELMNNILKDKIKELGNEHRGNV